MDALKRGRDLGLVNAVGVSNYKADQLEEAHGILDKLGLPLVSNQVRYNLLNRAPEKDGLCKVAEERGVKLVAYAPYAEGQLVGKTDDAKVRRLACTPPLNGDGGQLHPLDLERRA
jgi:aryl-alcohol dehydrogenase-like predicted oxidoreductase